MLACGQRAASSGREAPALLLGGLLQLRDECAEIGSLADGVEIGITMQQRQAHPDGIEVACLVGLTN